MIRTTNTRYGKREVKFWDRQVGRYSLGYLYKRGRNASLIVHNSGVTLKIPNRDIYPVMAEVPKR